MSIDFENNYEPQYINIRGKGPLIKELKKEAKKAKKVFLASDPDREGSYFMAFVTYTWIRARR